MNRDFNEFNISILSDFYEYTMAQGYFNENLNNKITYFDIFYRENPDGASYAIFSGLEHLTQILNSMRFNDEDIEYFKSLNTFDDKFRAYLPFASYSLACLIICEKLFSMYPYPVSDIVLYSDVSYNKILQKRYGFSLWEIVLKAMNMEQNSLSEDDRKMLYYFKILLSYEASRPEFYEFGIDKILDVSVHADMQSIIFIKKALQK